MANHKVKRELGTSPRAALEEEQPDLRPLPAYIPPVYDIVHRGVDTQGYVHLDTVCRVSEYVEPIADGAVAKGISGSVYSTYSPIASQGGDQLVG